MTFLSLKTLPAAAVALAAIGLGCTSVASSSTGPVACELRVSETAFGMSFEGQATAAEPVTGHFDFEIDKRGRSGNATIRQAGGFTLRPGEIATLGQATLNGNRSDFKTSLTLTVDGKKYSCGNAPIDL